MGINHYIRPLLLTGPHHGYEAPLLGLYIAIFFAGVFTGYFLYQIKQFFFENKVPVMPVEWQAHNPEDHLVALKNTETPLDKQMDIQSKLIASLIHDIRTPMRYTAAAILKIENLIEQPDLSGALIQTKNVGSSVALMSNFLDNTLEYIKMKYYGKQIVFHEITLKDLINEKIKLVYPSGAAQLNQFLNEVEEDIKVFSNHLLLGIILQNLIDNANKNSYKGQIRFFTQRDQEHIHLIISDTGPGFPETILRWAQRHARGETDVDSQVNPGPQPEGLGLFIVKEIADLLYIGLLIENLNGATVTLIFTIE